MKVRHSVHTTRAASTWALAIALVVAFSFATPHEAQAAKRAKTITRAQVLKRASVWVKRKVPYSQRSTYGGYRQDCSGFVSMSWQLGRSYTTRSLGSVSKRVSRKSLRPGDAVLTPGHVVIFGGWKNRRAGTFYAYEEPTWGKVATKRVRTMKGNAKLLRRVGIRNTPRRVVKRRPAPAPAPIPAPPVASAISAVTAAAVVDPRTY